MSFNPRARMGRDFDKPFQPLLPRLFQSTRPHGARRYTTATPPNRHKFQSTRPHGARHHSCSLGRIPIRFQSTRPHGARLAVITVSRRLLRVSIHAPAWGATGEQWKQQIRILVSIHAPAWGATGRLATRSIKPIRFQSTRPHGARPVGRRIVSGAACFNPRARMGRDFRGS